MSRSRGEHGAGPERLIVADATSGQFAVPTFAHRFAVVSALDEEDGAPVIRKEDEILLDWKQVRVHDLQQDAKPGVRDRRLQFQVVNNYEDSVEPPKDGMSPYAQAEVWTALNRSTREADGFGRVALPGSHRRIVGSEDGKFAIAQTLVEWQAAATGEVGSGADLPPPEGVAFKEPGIETGTGGTVSRSSPSVTVNGVTVFGDAAVGAARDAVNAGASASEVLAAAQSGKFTPPTVERPAEAPPDAPPAPSARPGGYVANEAKKIGLLGTVFTPALGEGVFTGREGEEIGVLPARGDFQIALSKEKRGRLHIKADDVANLEEPKKGGKRVKGWLMPDSSVAGQDSKLPGDLCQFRPVVEINAKIPPSGDPPPPPPPPKPKPPIGVIPPYLGGPGGGSGSKGKAELYPGGSSGEVPPSPPGETGDGLPDGDLTPVGVATGAGGGSAAPEGAVSTGPPAGGVRTPGAGTGEGPTAVATGPVANPQSQQRDLTGQLVAPVPCPLTTSGGAVATQPPSSAPEGNTRAGDGQPDPAAQPTADAPYEPGFPALQVVGSEVWLGGSRAGGGASGHPVQVRGAPVYAAVPFGSHNVLTTPVPVMGQPGGPADVEGQLAWLSYSVESLRRVLIDGLTGGPGYLASNVAAIHENGPGNPPAGSTIGGRWTARTGEALVAPSSFTVPGSLHADAGGTITRAGAGVLGIERGHSGDGQIVDKAPLLHLDNRARGETVSAADALSTHDRRAAITGGSQVLSAGLVAHRVDGETKDPFEVATVQKGQVGRNPASGAKDFIAWIPLSTQVLAATRGFMATKLYGGGQGGGLLTSPLDSTETVDGIPLRTRGGSLLITDDVDGTRVGGLTLTRRKAGSTDGTTVLSLTDSELGNSRSRIETDVLDPEAILFVPLAARPAEFVDIPDNKPGLWVDEADDDNRPVWWTGDCANGATDRPLAFQDELGASGLPKRYVEGLVIRYASSTTITVSTGKARDKADGADMTLSSGATVSTGTANAALGYERKTLTGTATWTNLSASVTGSSTAFLTEFGTRALSVGTIGTGGVALSTITGTGTKFLSEVAVYDLIGNSSVGYAQVTAIASDTSLSIRSNLTIANLSTGNVIEQPTIESAGGKRHSIYAIASNTALTLSASASGTETGVAAYATSGLLSPTGTAVWRAVWLLSGGSGTTVALSTQRTTPYLSITGYTTSYRRIGWVLIDSSGNLVAQYGTDGCCRRWVNYETSFGDIQGVANASSTTTYQDVVLSNGAPPTAYRLQIMLLQVSPNTVDYVMVRGRGLGSTAARVRSVLAPTTSTESRMVFDTPCDGAQVIQHRSNTSTTGDGTYIDLTAYEDTLE